MNRTCRLLAEFGVVIAPSANRFFSALPILIDDGRLPVPLRAMLLEVGEQLAALNLWLARCDQLIAALSRSSDVARRAGELFGVGPVTSRCADRDRSRRKGLPQWAAIRCLAWLDPAPA
jgi:transposase